MRKGERVKEAKVSVAELAEMARENVPLVGMLAMQVESVLPGAVTIRVPYRNEFIRPGGTVSGAVLMAVGEVFMHGGDEEDLVAHVTATYSIPPQGPGGAR
ncbi:MAG: hypothetical protein GWP69_07300 [Gammaproteobacteria bacterium]|nr:hypothetical protein [Gammaproteobacteria bacterium]NCF83556.1 hypothetical protein [Pseudomonadota bacterium]